MATKSIEQKFKKLTEVEHCLARPGRYIGSITPQTSAEWTVDETGKRMSVTDVTFTPAFLKLFDEVISNSADFSKTPDGKHVDVIRIEVDQKTGEISCYDNGGIPVVKHPEYDQYVPEMIFELRSGSNFDDDADSITTGQNGEGAALTCIFSEFFTVETCDTKNKFKMTFRDNSQTRPEPKVTPAKGEKGYTRITWKTEFNRFGMNSIDDGAFAMLRARTFEIAATNTHLKVYFNGERIMTRSFKEYIAMHLPEGTDTADIVYDDGGRFKVGVAKSENGFTHTSFVNSTRTRVGGHHITHVVDQIVDAVRAHIKKKNKVEVKPADVRNHLHLFVDCTLNNPRYSSQTKDEMISQPGTWGAKWDVPEKFIQKLLKTPVIQSILDWVAAKEQAALQAELRKQGKEMSKADPRRIDKFSDALEKKERTKCVLFIAEGDSAAKSIQGGRGKNPYIGSMPLKGKPLNVREKELARVLGLDKRKDGKAAEPNEIQKILTIIGLQVGVPVTSLEELRFGKLAITSDADVDGYHIGGLLMNLFDRFWPELFDLGFIHILRTPVVMVTLRDKSQLEFFTEKDFKSWQANEGEKLKGWSSKYYKGLSAWKTEQFAVFLNNLDKYLYKVDCPNGEADRDMLDLAFNSQRAGDRKVWLETPASNFEDFIVTV
jgi:DNA topoisomerase II